MEGWKRITLVASILIGSVSFFGYWSISQLNQVFDTLSLNLSAASVAHTRAVSSFLEKKLEVVASTSPAVFNVFATSTDPADAVSFAFLQEESGLYSGCTYPISLQASTTIASVEATLVEGGTRDPVEYKVSGLAKENALEKSQQIQWKVGAVSPGAYYIKISKIDGVAAAIRSNPFTIQSMPEGIDEKEKDSLCR
jgi:hypothetical protein